MILPSLIAGGKERIHRLVTGVEEIKQRFPEGKCFSPIRRRKILDLEGDGVERERLVR